MSTARADDDFDDYQESGTEGEGRLGLPVDPGRLWLSIKRDWRWVPIAFLIWTGLGLLIAFGVMKPSYKSESVIVWEPRGQGMADQRVLATQAGSIKMPITLAKVKQRLKLPYSLQSLGEQVEVWFDTRSHLVTVQGGGPTKEEAQLLTRTVIGVFIENQTEIARARAGDSATALGKDLEAARMELAKARQAYDAFRADHGVSDIDSETQIAVQTAAGLKEDQRRAQVEATALSARAEKLDSLFKKQRPTTVQSATSSNTDAMRVNQLQTELAAARARYSADHPRIRTLESELQAVQAASGRSKTVASNVVTGMNPEYQSLQASLSSTRADQEAASQRNDSLGTLAVTAEARVAALSAIEGTAKTLLAEVDVAEQRIARLELEYSNARDSVRTPSIEFRVLTPAALPEWPEKSKRKYIAIAMSAAGLLISFMLLLVRPVMDGRVYTAREAAYWARLPVIGSTAWPRDREMFFPLIDELGDDGSVARGFTLVLGATGREKALAEELAYWLGGSALGNGRGQAGAVENGGDAHVAAASGASPQRAPATPGTIDPNATMLEHAAPPPPQQQPPQAQGHALALRPGPGGAAIMAYPKGQTAMTPTRAGAHAWVGDNEGPALRRAARSADRVLVVLTSGAELFTSVAGLRTRLGRDQGVAVLLLGLSPELLKLPDRIGDVERFWRHAVARA